MPENLPGVFPEGHFQGHVEFSAKRWRGWGTQGALLPVVAPARQCFDVPIGGPD
eukprot:COSAG01_NODE_22212_length_866_cov_2.105606_1_plen_53_part_01